MNDMDDHLKSFTIGKCKVLVDDSGAWFKQKHLTELTNTSKQNISSHIYKIIKYFPDSVKNINQEVMLSKEIKRKIRFYRDDLVIRLLGKMKSKESQDTLKFLEGNLVELIKNAK